MKIEEIEQRFKEVTDLNHVDFTIFPHTEKYSQKRRVENKHFGEVFTPTFICDKMINLCDFKPDGYNMDLCAGQGQFTIRILRYLHNNFPGFDCEYYLKSYHWFVEINPINVESLLYIFGNNINIAVGDARKLSNYPEDFDGIWQKGIFYFDGKNWVRKLEEKKEFKPTNYVNLMLIFKQMTKSPKFLKTTR